MISITFFVAWLITSSVIMTFLTAMLEKQANESRGFNSSLMMLSQALGAAIVAGGYYAIY